MLSSTVLLFSEEIPRPVMLWALRREVVEVAEESVDDSLVRISTKNDSPDTQRAFALSLQ